MSKTKSVFLKLKRAHEKGFRLGKHKITAIMTSYELDEKEQKELKTAGPQHWIKEYSKKEIDALPKSNAENKKIQKDKKAAKKLEEDEKNK